MTTPRPRPDESPKSSKGKVSRPRYNKYHNIKTVVDGITFASKKEASRYEVLRDEQQAGKISQLRLQVPYDIYWPGQKKKLCRYICDFLYVRDGKEIVEDTKGKKTAEFRLKEKMMKYAFGIDILIT